MQYFAYSIISSLQMVSNLETRLIVLYAYNNQAYLYTHNPLQCFLLQKVHQPYLFVFEVQ